MTIVITQGDYSEYTLVKILSGEKEIPELLEIKKKLEDMFSEFDKKWWDKVPYISSCEYKYRPYKHPIQKMNNSGEIETAYIANSDVDKFNEVEPERRKLILQRNEEKRLLIYSLEHGVLRGIKFKKTHTEMLENYLIEMGYKEVPYVEVSW